MNKLSICFLLLLLSLPALMLSLACGTDDDDDQGDDDDDNDNDNGDIWSPAPGTTWQWQLTGSIDASFEVAMYDIDLFETAEEVIADLHAAGRVVICYFSAGSYEDWRPDAGDFPEAALGKPLDGWEGEWWLDVRLDAIREIMLARLERAVAKNCDGVEPDNVEAFANDNGLGLTAADQLEYNRFLADEAHARGLSIGLKNDLSQASVLVDDFDWALNEECLAYDECDELDPFIAAGKAVFHVEYVEEWSEAEALAAEVCGKKPQFSTLIKLWDLTAERLSCD